ncbi:hypothetical protein [Chromobacterium violaceum]|uniref:hypothetical protein n=1 Tax=Chromobacterium violaceum TaxID=536 RepID=UPI001B326D7B|nr:hypothetical protein [Chromobacterium violaceum]MBP4043488.1 hypothetical protein [Chromobacterium violaceum]
MKKWEAYMRFAVVALWLVTTGATAGEIQQIEHALRHIPSAAHGTAWNALVACRMKIDRRASALDKIYGDPRYTRLHLIVSAPPPSREDAYIYRELLLRWEIRDGHATPLSAWAETIQLAPVILPWAGC